MNGLSCLASKIVLFFVAECGACGISVAGAAARRGLWSFHSGIKYALVSNWVLRTGSGRERVDEYKGNRRCGFGELLLQTSVRPSYKEMCCNPGPRYRGEDHPRLLLLFSC